MSCPSLLHFGLSKIVLMAMIVGLTVAGCAIVLPLLTAADETSRRRRRWVAGILLLLTIVGVPIAAALYCKRSESACRARIRLTVSRRRLRMPPNADAFGLPSNNLWLRPKAAPSYLASQDTVRHDVSAPLPRIAVRSVPIAGRDLQSSELSAIVLNRDKVVPQATAGELDATEPSDSDDKDSKTAAERVPLPDWTQDFKAEAVDTRNVPVRVVRSGQFATVEQAKAEALHKAVIAATRRIANAKSYLTGDWHAPESLVREHVVRQTCVETLEHDFGTITAPMYRVYLQIDLSDAILAPLIASWQQSVVTHRLCLLGGVLGVAVILLVTLSLCLRPRRNTTPPELSAAQTT